MSSDSHRQLSAPAWIPNRYPTARRSDHHDEYESKERGGTVKIDDPYQWLESHTQETTKWIEGKLHFSKTSIRAKKAI
jgi:prolyl oligopeptidase